MEGRLFAGEHGEAGKDVGEVGGVEVVGQCHRAVGLPQRLEAGRVFGVFRFAGGGASGGGRDCRAGGGIGPATRDT